MMGVTEPIRMTSHVSCAVCAALLAGVLTPAAPCANGVGTLLGTDRVSASEKGSVLVFPKVEVRWDAQGNLVQDTFLQLTNDFPEDVDVLMYLINGDRPLPAIGDERAHPGWNWLDNGFTLTANQTTYWSVATGEPFGLSPFEVLDPADPDELPGRPDPDGSTDRVLRGYLVAFAVNNVGEEIRWNHLAGTGTLIDYRASAAWEYNAWVSQSVNPVIGNGEQTGDPGEIGLDGFEFAPLFDLLLMNFQAVGSAAFTGPNQVITDTDLTLLPGSVDVRQESDGPVTTKAHFEVWSENEVKFSGSYRCVTCWDQTLLSNYGVPNNFLLETLQTDFGKARIDGVMSELCDEPGFDPPIISIDAALLGVVATLLTIDGEPDAAAGFDLIGMGFEEAVIRFDTLEIPPEMPEGDDELSKEEAAEEAGTPLLPETGAR
jgi:hypothetical protein